MGTSDPLAPLAALSGNESVYSVNGCVSVMTSAARQTFGGPGIRGTDSWLDDTDKNFGPDLPLLFKMREIWSVDSQKIIKIVATRFHILRLKCTKFDFGAGALQRSAELPVVFKGPTPEGREERESEGESTTVDTGAPASSGSDWI